MTVAHRARARIPIVVVLLLAASAAAQGDKTDDFIKTQMKRQNIPGLSLVVVKDGQIIKSAGYGVADRERRIPATPETVYKIASVSKQFIATGIMLLAQDGQVSVDDAVSKYLEGTPDSWKPITIRHLLTHTAGLVREAPGFDPRKVQNDADVIRTTYAMPLRFTPGEKYEYSNTGYFALAEIIRKVSGRPWSEYLTDKVFKPSGMNTTYTTNTTEKVPNRAVGYRDNDKLLNAGDWAALRPSGAFLSTVLDLAKWDAVLNTDRILTESTRRQMWTPVTLNDGSSGPYGFGWQISSVKDHKHVHHYGGMLGFRTAFSRFPDNRLTVIVLTNLDEVDIESIVHGVAALYLPTLSPARAP